MSRPLRIQAPGLTYHITSRGNGQMTLFLDGEDYHLFLEEIAEIVERRHVLCHELCAMKTHYHLVATTQEANLSLAIRDLNGEFARRWNERHRHVGHVFQGRFHAQIVQNESYLLTACRYVVLNPVRAGLVVSPEQWRWSSYRVSAGLDPAPAYLSPALIWSHFGPAEEAARRYREFVCGYLGSFLPSDPVLGDDDFKRRFEPWRRRASREVPRREKEQHPTIDQLFQSEASRAIRDGGIRRAHREGYSIPAIARFLGLHPNTIRKVLVAPSEGVE